MLLFEVINLNNFVNIFDPKESMKKDKMSTATLLDVLQENTSKC